MSGAPHPKTSPWLGPESFTEDEADRFFGRTREERRLTRLVDEGLLTVLFGDSGLGKTSLIRAGLFPELRKRHHTPIYLRLRFDNDAPPLVEQVWQRIDEFAGVERENGEWPETLWQWFHDSQSGLKSERLSGASMVIVFDQFEELFTKGGEGARREESGKFLLQLADLAENRVPEVLREIIESKSRKAGENARREKIHRRYLRGGDPSLPPYRILLSLRADYLYLFDRLAGLMRSGMKRRMELEPMARKEALEAIRKPDPSLITQEVAELLVSRLARETDDDCGIDLLDDGKKPVWIQPGVLSLVCDRLNRDRIKAGRDEISGDQIHEKFDSIFLNYYDEAFEQLPLDARNYVEDHFVDVGGHRVLLSREAVDEAIGESVVDELINSRLVQGDERAGVKYVELVHDRFAIVAKARREARHENAEAEAKRRQDEQLAREAAERARCEEERIKELETTRKNFETVIAGLEVTNRDLAEREQAIKRRTFRMTVFTLGFLALILVGFVIFFFTLSKKFGRELGEREANLAQVQSAADAFKNEIAVTKSVLVDLQNDKREAEIELDDFRNQLAERERELAKREGDLVAENEALREQVLGLEEKVRTMSGDIVGTAQPTAMPVDPEIVVDQAVREAGALALVSDFLEAGSGIGERKQWELFAEKAFFVDEKVILDRDDIREKIKGYDELLKGRSYWLKAPPWIEEESPDGFELGALYGFQYTNEGKVTYGATEGRFVVNFGPRGEPLLGGFSPSKGTVDGKLSDFSQFERLLGSRSKLNVDPAFPDRERWLALITHELYVLAGQSYKGIDSNGISPEAGRKIEDQTEFLADTIDYFEEGTISRAAAWQELRDYKIRWEVRKLRTLSEPRVTHLEEKNLWQVESLLSYLTENSEEIREGEVESTVLIRIHPDRGPEIVSLRSQSVEQEITAKVPPAPEKKKGLFRGLFKSK